MVEKNTPFENIDASSIICRMKTGWAIVLSLVVLGVVVGCAWAVLPGILRIKVGGSTPISQYTFV